MDWKLTRNAIGEPEIDHFHDDPDEDIALGYALIRAMADVHEHATEIRPGAWYFTKSTDEKMI